MPRKRRRGRGFTLVEVILLAVLVGMLTAIAALKYATHRDKALQNQIDTAVVQLNYVKVRLQESANVGQMGVPASADFTPLWPVNLDVTLNFDVGGRFTGCSHPEIGQVLQRYLLNEAQLGTVFLNYAAKGLRPKETTPLEIVYPVNGATQLHYDASRRIWVFSSR